MKWKWPLVVLIVMIVVTNLPIIGTNFMLMFDGNKYFRYSNNNGSRTIADDVGFKNGALTPTVMLSFIEKENPKPENRELFRIYRINPLCFWRWSYYFGTSSDFKYKPWKDIEANRVPYDPENRWQDF